MNESHNQERAGGFAGTGGDPALAAGRSSLVGGISRRTSDATRTLWYSNAPWCGTGYGQQTQQAVKRLVKEGHEVAIHANYGLEGSTSNWNGIKIYPRGLNPYSDDIIVAHWMEWTQNTNLPKLLITLFDVWVLKAPNLDKVPNIASWVPIDHAPCPPDVLRWCQRPNVMPIAMSKFGKSELDKAGVRNVYIPHAVESIYKPTKEIRDNANQVLTGRKIMGFEEDQFVVMMTAANKGVTPTRKSFAENFMAFSMFAAKHPDAVLYMHTEASSSMGGIDLKSLATAVGIPDEKIKWADPYLYRMGLPHHAMAAMYSDADVLLACSMGEGFGIPVIEAQACGTRVIVSNFTAQPELVGDGWVVEGQPWYDPMQGAFFIIPSVPSILNALEASYAASRGTSQKAVDFAKQYEADTVYETHWKPAMKEIVGWCRSSSSQS